MSPATAVAMVAAELAHQTALGFAVAFTPDKARVGRMRRITAAHLRLWKVSGPSAENIVLAVSELVANAIEHGYGDIELTVLYACGEVRVEVKDGNPAPAKLTIADDEDVSGRGLFLVAVLAQDWGVGGDGRSTWCVFRIRARRS
ncbi:putative anti-sigma regulatory factor, serine/threonine protein kinase [Actinobacteria bacterium OV320]|nr:putative anti-sigma regulatory factor, serine/threonine protein kinase [Actinobacteria bacterium OV320]